MTLMQADLDPYRRRFRGPKWNSYPTVTDVPRLFTQLPEFQGWTKDQHYRLALGWLEQAEATQTMYAGLATRMLGIYGEHGPLISGCVRDHFPDAIKDDLRTLARIVSEGTREESGALAGQRATE